MRVQARPTAFKSLKKFRFTVGWLESFLGVEAMKLLSLLKKRQVDPPPSSGSYSSVLPSSKDATCKVQFSGLPKLRKLAAVDRYCDVAATGIETRVWQYIEVHNAMLNTRQT